MSYLTLASVRNCVAALAIALCVVNQPASAEVTLYGVTGDGSPTPSTLFTINPTTGAAAPVLTLDNSADAPDGEGITFNPHDGLLYRTSGLRAGSQVLQTINPLTLAVGPNLAMEATYGPDPASEVFGIAWYEPLGVFLVTTLNSRLYHVTPDGQFTNVGPLGEWMRGLAVVGTRVYGSGPSFSFFRKIWEIDPVDGTILDEKDLVIDGQLTWATALTTHPLTGAVFGIVKNPGDPNGPRWLAKIDVTTGLGTAIGNTGEKFAGMTFVFDPVTFDDAARNIVDGLAAGLIDNQGVAQSLLAKLAAAQAAAEQGQTVAATNILAALALEIEAQAGKHISPELAEVLLLDADTLSTSLGGGS